jgi:hypothetical protein
METPERSADTISIARWCEMGDSLSGCAIYGPSLITLIADQGKFDGRRVRVIGYVHFEFEGNGLYLSQESIDHRVYKNGLWIEPPDRFGSDSGPVRSPTNDRYVIVEGTFRAGHGGHFGMWSGTIEHVTRLDPWGPPKAPTKVKAR